MKSPRSRPWFGEVGVRENDEDEDDNDDDNDYNDDNNDVDHDDNDTRKKKSMLVGRSALSFRKDSDQCMM